MTQEDKQLLLKDLCARLPYSTLCYCKWAKDVPNSTSGCVDEVSTYLLEELEIIGNPKYECQICEIKPYLRPMSSMTEEENEELSHLLPKDWSVEIDKLNNFYFDMSPSIFMEIDVFLNIIDWFNSHHFDYRGLIKKGLALEAPEGIYK